MFRYTSIEISAIMDAALWFKSLHFNLLYCSPSHRNGYLLESQYGRTRSTDNEDLKTAAITNNIENGHQMVLEDREMNDKYVEEILDISKHLALHIVLLNKAFDIS